MVSGMSAPPVGAAAVVASSYSHRQQRDSPVAAERHLKDGRAIGPNQPRVRSREGDGTLAAHADQRVRERLTGTSSRR